MCQAMVLKVQRFVWYESTAALCQKRECYFLCHVSLTHNFLWMLLEQHPLCQTKETSEANKIMRNAIDLTSITF